MWPWWTRSQIRDFGSERLWAPWMTSQEMRFQASMRTRQNETSAASAGGKGCQTPVILVVAEEESVVHEDAQVVFSLSANVRFRAQVVRASHRQAESFLL